MPSEEIGLRQLAMPQRVHAELANNRRLVAHEVLQSAQVTAKDCAIVQIHVEHREIDKRKLQILRRWKIGVCQKRLWISLLRNVSEPLQKPLHPSLAVPAD